MRQLSLSFFMLLLGCLLSLPALGQRDLFNGIFDQEEPVFHATVLPSSNKGEVKLTYYFTHSKLSNIEVSFWIKDMGTSFRETGSKVLVKGLEEVGNRQQNTIVISGLSDQHFYTIGADYRNPKSISRKFNSAVLEEGYRYTHPVETAAGKQSPDMPSSVKSRTMPCKTPDISVMMEPGGYCGANNRPAVVIQCLNYRNENWEFSVEIRPEWGDWRSLRADGRRQSAIGSSPRTEPFCTLVPGDYYVRVKAWGEYCETPVVNSLATAIVISDPRSKPDAIASLPVEQDRDLARKSPSINLPDTCVVSGFAYLDQSVIRGTLRLNDYSPCSNYNPYAKIRYVHPAHRDITIDQVPLRAGEETPFFIRLDERDLNRGIHTIQIVSYLNPDPASEGIPMGSFWLQAKPDGGMQQPMAGTVYNPQTPLPPPPPPGYEKQSTFESPMSNATSDYETGRKKKSGQPTEEEFTPSISEDIETISVSASDPNCTSIQDLQLVYSAAQPLEPLYISWLSPRCCQEQGCDYSVWAGKTPEKLRLIVQGNKPGALVREILQNLQYNDAYFEVVVKTSNGNRKAAYILDKGPIYGLEEVLAYHDQFNPQKSDPLVLTKHPGEFTADVEDAAAFELDKPLLTYEKPSMPITDFVPCKYKRKTTLVAEEPVISGDEVLIKYDYSGTGYKYSLYHLPEGAEEWVLAPGTEELQSKPNFDFEVNKTGKYLILTYHPGKNWGCLSAPVSESLEVKVEE